jgi:hypothetical protein
MRFWFFAICGFFKFPLLANSVIGSENGTNKIIKLFFSLFVSNFATIQKIIAKNGKNNKFHNPDFGNFNIQSTPLVMELLVMELP